MNKSQKGFGLIYSLVIIIVIAAIVVAGVLVYRHDHNKTNNSTASDNSSQQTASTNSSAQTTDPYAGWKTYCDKYNYCFRYPSDWSLTFSSLQVTLTSPANNVEIDYINPYSQDSSPLAFTPTTIEKLMTANEDLTAVGGYSPSKGLAGAYAPSYRVVDSALLRTYPLTLNKSSRFPNNSGFTNKFVDNSTGAFMAKPSVTINTVADAKSWLMSADGKTALQILESIYYK